MTERPAEAAPEATPPPRLSDRARKRRGEILRAAHEVFTAKGYRNGSLGEIADATASCAARASSGVGCSRNERARSVTRSRSLRAGG